jgi:phage-related protein
MATEQQPAAPAAPAQASEKGQLMDIGTVAAHNIAAAVGLGEEHVATIRNAIRDEISAMGSHFSLAMADVQTHFEVEVNTLKTKFAQDVAAIKNDFVWVKANKAKIAVVVSAALVVGGLLGRFVL